MEVPLVFVPPFSVTNNVGDDDDDGDDGTTQLAPGIVDPDDDDVDEDDGSNTGDEVGGIEDEDMDNNVEFVEDGADVDALATECPRPLNSHLLIT